MSYIDNLVKLGLHCSKYCNGKLERDGYKIKKDQMTDAWVSEKSV